MNWLKASISGGVGFIIAIAVAICIEKCGGAIGGIISSVPTTIVPTSYILLTEAGKTKLEQTESLYAGPIGILATNLFFLPIWKLLPAKLEKFMSNTTITFLTLFISLVFWFISALLVSWIESVVSSRGVLIWQFSLVVMLICAVVGFILCWSLPPTPKGKNKVKWYIHICRGLAATLCIFISSWLSSSGFGLFAGAFSGFPAIFSTSIVSVSLAQGASVSTGAVGPMIIGGCAGGWYALLCGTLHLVTSLHILLCIVISHVVVVLFWNVPVYYYVRWRRDVTALKKEIKVATTMEVFPEVVASSVDTTIEHSTSEKEKEKEIEMVRHTSSV